MTETLEAFAVSFVIFLTVYVIVSHTRNEMIKTIDERFCKLEEDFREMRKVFMK